MRHPGLERALNDDVKDDNYVEDDVKEEDNDSDNIEEKFIDPNIDKVSGWVYGKDGTFPNVLPILDMLWKGRWTNGRAKTFLTYEQIIGKGNRKRGIKLDQEQLDFLVHQWL